MSELQMPTEFLTAAAVAREVGRSLQSVRNYTTRGLITPSGRVKWGAGEHAMLFTKDSAADLKQRLTDPVAWAAARAWKP